ncbi:type VI secretion system protein IglI family protein [Nannocystis sp. SCPEA4]|uniref:type VI secretion system protein IglI family protein n=1 Tax=Nannocystis sp. SCPEA4 TaxID=2996787 RepID=UPI00226EC6D9|nr:type VI secretion system protein IglI family protein [Nannocystis sp. SCPEA4]MCY1059602.1 type VI secretion system protein IglI family protein [Nannocystis sp. SCPEA4]
MSERLPSPVELLQGRPPGSAGVDTDANGVVHKLLDLADRGDYLEAAERAAELLRGPANDVRLIAIYLAGLFVERGAPALPELLGCVERLLGEGQRPSGTSGGRPIDSALEWLFRAVTDRAAFHTTRRDDVWQAWLRDLAPAQVDEIAARADAILARSAGGAAALQKLTRWARSKLAPAVARAKKTAPPEAATPAVLPPAPEPDPEPPRPPAWDAPDPDPVDDAPEELDDDDLPEREEDDDAYEDDEQDDDDEFVLDPRSRSRPRTTRGDEPRFDHTAPAGFTVTIESPALAELRDKLRAFEIVLARGEMDRAAVIAHDVQAVLGSFDPVVYMPSLFARYSELLHGNFAEIEARWGDTSTPQWRILVQFYRTNLAGFAGE